MTDKNLYMEKAKARLEQWNAEIDKMKAKAHEAEADAKIKYQEQIEEMRKHRDEAELKMQEIAAANEDAWKDMKAGFDKAWDGVSDAFSKAMSRFK